MTELEGHEQPLREFSAAMRGERLHHAWLLAGPLGVGKASFARWAATALIEGRQDGQNGMGEVLRQIAENVHPDVRLVTRLAREGASETGELKRSIGVDQIRQLLPFLHARPAFGERKAVIIDSVDDLERAGANALLKVLEEPVGDCVFLLVSHAPDQLLATIRSRCRLLRFSPLEETAMHRVLRRLLPDLATDDRTTLVAAADGSPGRALAFADDEIARIDQLLGSILQTGDPSGAAASRLASELTGKAAQPRFQFLLERVPALLAELARTCPADRLAPVLAAYDSAVELGSRAGPLNLDRAAVALRMAALLAQAARVRQPA